MEYVRKTSGAPMSAMRGDAPAPVQRKAVAGAGFAAQEAALQPKAEGDVKQAAAKGAKGSGFTWPLNDAFMDMYQVIRQVFPGLKVSDAGGVDELKWSVYDAKTGKMIYVSLSGDGAIVCGKAQGAGLTVTDDGAYWASYPLEQGHDVVAKLKGLKPPAK